MRVAIAGRLPIFDFFALQSSAFSRSASGGNNLQSVWKDISFRSFWRVFSVEYVL